MLFLFLFPLERRGDVTDAREAILDLPADIFQ
jgi:hypothetical protein